MENSAREPDEKNTEYFLQSFKIRGKYFPLFFDLFPSSWPTRHLNVIKNIYHIRDEFRMLGIKKLPYKY